MPTTTCGSRPALSAEPLPSRDRRLARERIPGSFDATSGSLDAPGGLLDFHAKPHDTPLILNPKTGAVVSGG